MFASRLLLSLFLLSMLNACQSGKGDNPSEPIDFFDLEVTLIGGGSITSTPMGINCGVDCSEQFDSNTTVALAQLADNGFSFNGWQGDCTGLSDCLIDMSANKSVSAEFISTLVTHHLLTLSITGSGLVSSTPAGINCGIDCTEPYAENAVVELSTSPAINFMFDHWSGACSGNVSCSVTMTEAKSVIANFVAISTPSTLIENYSALNSAITLSDIPKDASGITWHAGINQYLIIRNNAAIIYRYDVNFSYLGSISINNIGKDTEGISYVSGNEVLVVAEDNRATKVTIDESTTVINGSISNVQRYRIIAPSIGNKGLEGIATRKASAANPLVRVYACQEGTGSASGSNADKRVVYFDMPNTSAPFTLLSYDTNLTVLEPWDAEAALLNKAGDLAGMVYDARTDHLILLSERSNRALQVNPETGAIISELDISGANQFEGVTLGPNNELVFVSEPNLVRVYTQ